MRNVLPGRGRGLSGRQRSDKVLASGNAAYTSFIAVREKVVNPNGDANGVEQPLPLPVGVSEMAVGSEPELFLLIAMAFVTLIVIRRRTTLTNPICQ